MDYSQFGHIENQETFKDLFDNAHDLIHIVHLDGKLMYVNTAWERVLKYSQDEVQLTDISSMVIEQDRERFRTYRGRVIDGQDEGKPIIVGFSSKDGEVIYMEGVVSVKRVEGIPLYTRGIFHDVTRRLKDEAELLSMTEQIREREYNLSQLLLHAPDAIIVIDEAGTILLWNPKSEQIFGWKSSEVVGTSLSESIIPERFRDGHNRGIKRYLATGEERVLNKTIEVSACDKTGREFYISLTVSRAMQQGKTAFIAFLRDIDLQKRNQLELNKNRVELEHSNQELERFAHVTSHDMKEPVRKIRLFANQLEVETRGNLSEQAQRILDKIKTSAKRMTEMIDAILTYSSVGAVGREAESVDLNVVFMQVKTDLELMIEQKEARISSVGLPTIEGIPVLLHQLVYNLVNNSLKFSRPEIAPVIEIQCTPIHSVCSYAPATAYEISVIDNGIGIDPEYSVHIFETFSRLHSYGQYEGTGLGLALCKRIVEMHGGTIKAQDNGNGATVSFTLPATQVVLPQ